MLFGESDEITGIAESDAQCQLKEKMRSVWGAFIADPRHGLEEVGWPHYNPEGELKKSSSSETAF